jgi:hypothetical protein
LLDGATHLVHAGDDDIGAGVHSPLGERVVERQMRAPRLVDDERDVARVAYRGDPRDVRAGAPIGGRDQEHALRVGMRSKCGVDVGRLGWMGKVQLVVVMRVHPDGLDPGEDEPADDGLV